MTTEPPLAASPNLSTPAKSIDLSDVVASLDRIEAILGEQSSAVFSRKLAARYLGISPASLDRLAASVPELRPIHPTPGRSVWRKSDLQTYLDNL
jgi:hypothetical protein